VLLERQRSGLQHEDAMRVGPVEVEQPGRERGPEAPAAQDDEIERARIRLVRKARVRALQGLVQRIARVPARDVEGEGRILRDPDGDHALWASLLLPLLNEKA